VGLGAGLTGLLTVCPMGDSITVGAGTSPGDSTLNTGYRNPLWVLGQNAGIPMSFQGQNTTSHDASVRQIYHDGVVGDTIAMIKARAQVSVPIHYPEVLLLHAGTNDANIFSTPAPTILASLDDLILNCWLQGQRTGLNRLKLIEVAQITALPNGNNSIVLALNALIPAMAAAHRAAGRNVQVVNMYDALGDPFGSNFNQGSPPHPNAAGSQIMATKWFGTTGSGLLCDWGR